jgi:pimeloyl-ACP methyl ester carboxylesterase
VTKILGLQAKIRRSLQFRRQLLESPTASELLFQRRWGEVQAELLQERLSWLKVPVLILQGTQDTPMAVAQSQTYAHLAPATEVCVMEGGQDLAGDLPERVAQQIRKFVSTSIPM